MDKQINGEDTKQHQNCSKDLSQNIYRLGQSIREGGDQQTSATQLNRFQQSLELYTQSPRMKKLGHWFDLSQIELTLIAIAYVNTLEPDTLAPFLGISWFDNGATLSLERALLLCQNSEHNKVHKLEALLSDLTVFRWQILVLNEHTQPLIQPLNLASDIFSYLVGNKRCLDNQVGAIRTLKVQYDPAIAVSFEKNLKQPPAQVNMLSGLDFDERSALVAQYASKKSLPCHYVQTNVATNMNIHDLMRAFRHILLTAEGKGIYLYWPDLMHYIVQKNDSEWLVPLLSKSKLVMFYDDALAFNESDTSLTWLDKQLVEKCLAQATSKAILQLSAPTSARVAIAWQALAKQLQQQYPTQIVELSSTDAEYLASLYPIYPSVMSRVGSEVANVLQHRHVGESLFRLIQTACLKANSEMTGKLASLSQPKYQLSDMILAESTQDQLQELIDRLRFKAQLSQAIPNFLPGIQALFWGKPGTGKSMAAEAIAGQLKLPLYKVNLANVASKWIGESEKHLAKLFDDAQKQNAVLLFDEADAIFAKRSEVESSQDKNANMGVSFLLQRMETYTGLLLLSTNFKSNVDDAFLRRFHGVIEFIMPDEPLRAILWQQAWQGSSFTVTGINFNALAKLFEFTPSQIKNIAQRAMLYALKEGKRKLDKPLIAKAIARELEKQNGSFLAEQQLKSWLL